MAWVYDACKESIEKQKRLVDVLKTTEEIMKHVFDERLRGLL
jgi:hypothetical protein